MSRGIPCEIRKIDDEEQVLVETLLARTVILQRAYLSPIIDLVLKFTSLAGSVTVFETDDLTFDPDAIARIHHLQSFKPDKVKAFHKNTRGQAETIARCHYLLTSTEPIAEHAVRMGKKAFVQRNGYSREMAIFAENAIAKVQQNRSNSNRNELPQPVCLGYFSGSNTHDLDLASITPGLITTLRRHPETRLRIVGPVRINEAFNEFGGRIERLPAVHWQQLPDLVADVDINLVPLEINNCFCDAKSEVKYLEAGLVRVPTIATATPAYRHAISHGTNGMLADSIDAWPKLLSEMIQRPDLRLSLGETARQRVLREYSPESRASQLIASLEAMRADLDQRTESIPLSLMDANATMQDRLRTMAATLQEQNRRWDSAREMVLRAGQLISERFSHRFSALFRGKKSSS